MRVQDDIGDGSPRGIHVYVCTVSIHFPSGGMLRKTRGRATENSKRELVD
jgi:hypothetical protein